VKLVEETSEGRRDENVPHVRLNLNPNAVEANASSAHDPLHSSSDLRAR
jgi:hypothetical protein